LVAASSVAVADPVAQFRPDPIAYRDHRWRQPQFTALSPKMLDGNGRATIKLAEAKDDLLQLRLQAGVGATYVYSMILQYDNGSRETIQVGKWLWSQNAQMTYDVPQGKGGIDRITVRTWSNVKSTFQVLGQEARRARPVPPVYDPPPPPMPASLALGTNLSFPSSGYLHLPVGVEKGRFSKIKIVNNGFGTYLGTVTVGLATGTSQTITLNKPLGRGQSIELDIAGARPQAVTAITLMQQHDVRTFAPATGKLDVTLLR
jgi:hypothetical protein